MKKLMKVAVPFAVALFVGACAPGYSTQEAYEICEAERESNAAIDDVIFAECVACYEDCTDCTAQGTSPESFACPED